MIFTKYGSHRRHRGITRGCARAGGGLNPVRWAREGVDPATIARRLGHETPMVALQVYIEAQEGRTAADDRIDELAAEVIAKVAARVHDECTVTPIARREAR